ncbi:MAG: hypothetical protein ABJB86_18255 [Bacteroidota bacterium]
MKKTKWMVVIMVILTITSCKKLLTDNIPVAPPVDDTPIATELGIPVGIIVTKNIGAGGGSLTSGDGKVELQIPAGALSGNTDISIQPITNTAPNGISNGYRFMPDGLKFSTAATLKIHYAAADVAGSLPDLLGIAFQDSTGFWWRVNNFTNDQASKTIAVPMMHFSDWTLFEVMKITPSSAAVRTNKSVNLDVTYINGDNDDEQTVRLLRKVGKITWSATAGALSVTTDNTDMSRVYKAPATIPAANPVAVSAQVQITFKYHGKTFNNTTLVANIAIYNTDEVYVLELKIEDGHWWQGMVAIDSVSMRVKVQDTTVTISNIVNFPSAAVPPTLVAGNATVIWIPDPIGELNITKAAGRNAVDFFGDNTGYLGFDFTHTGVHTPKYHVVTPPSSDQYYGGTPDPGFLLGTSFHTTAGRIYYEQGTTDPYSNIIVTVKLTLQF